MKRKTKKIIIILLCVAAVLAIAGYAAYNAALDYVQDKMIASMLDSMLDSGEVTLSELELMAEAELPDTEPPAAEDEQPAPAVPDAPDSSAGQAQTPAAPPSSAPASSAPSSAAPSPSSPAPAASSNEAAEPETRTEVVDKMTQKISDSITREDKRAMTRLITSHLGSSDIKYLAGLISGGLTREERTAAYRLAKQRFSESELDIVSSYYHRYKKQIMIEPDYPTS